MAQDQEPIPAPAVKNYVVQAILDTQWREALRAASEGIDALRLVYPDLIHHLPDTAADGMKRALKDFEDAATGLHQVGRLVIGQDGYDEYLDAQTKRRLSS